MKKILISGNEAIAEGAIRAGCTFYAGYPITPQNELIGYMAEHMQDRGGVFIQAESEVAAINMVYGAAATGVRAMTSSSSPGVSLKQEGISYIAGAELPVVIVNIMRGGPGLGNIWPGQSDYFQATRGGGHGDYRCIVLAPANVQECYDMMILAFNLADQYRNPVLILGDAMLGQMMEPLNTSTKFVIKNVDKSWALTGCKDRKPNIVKSFYMVKGDLEKFNLKLQKKYEALQAKEERWEEFLVKDAKLVLVAYGSMARIAKAAVKTLRLKGKKVGLIRPITLWPFPKQAFKKPKDKYLVVEMSYGQLIEDVKLSLSVNAQVGFIGRAGGGFPSEEEIIVKANKLYNG
ncbi:MAG: 3-methyl-2-oxobutanoate dehydrogenase subunit VorB [Candidatus Omnitrophica bacterium]|nr:3-methyl-2-oxobutanoate dehydrogenase subunit VorB [Candidatus Omnitrophota bacterium]